jgi:hypothetical protein
MCDVYLTKSKGKRFVLLWLVVSVLLTTSNKTRFIIKDTVFWIVTPCSLIDTNFSEEPVAFIFTVDLYTQ